MFSGREKTPRFPTSKDTPEVVSFEIKLVIRAYDIGRLTVEHGAALGWAVRISVLSEHPFQFNLNSHFGII